MRILFFLLLLAFVATINFTLPVPLVFYDTQRVVLVFIVSVITVFLGWRVVWDIWLGGRRSRSGSLLLLLFVALVFLSLFSVYPLIALRESLLLILSALSVVALACLFDLTLDDSGVNARQILLAGCLAAFGLYYFQFLVGFITGIVASSSIEREVLIHHFSNIRFVNHLQVLSTPLLVYLFMSSSKRIIRVAAFLVASIGIAILLFCSARAATGCLLIGFVLAQFLLRFDRAFIRATLSILASGVVIFAVVFKLLPSLVFAVEVQEPKINLNSSGRWDLWVEAVSLISENWLLGIGPQHYSLYSEYAFAHPHNLILQLALDYGVVVTGLLTVGLFWFGLRVYQMIGVPNKFGFEKACAWALIAIFGTSLFSGVWVAPMTQLMIVFLSAPLVAVLRFSSRQYDKQGSASRFEKVSSQLAAKTRSAILFNRLLGIGIIATNCTWVWLVGIEVKQRINAPIVAGDKETKMIYAPRFWQYQHWVLPIEEEQIE